MRQVRARVDPALRRGIPDELAHDPVQVLARPGVVAADTDPAAAGKYDAVPAAFAGLRNARPQASPDIRSAVRAASFLSVAVAVGEQIKSALNKLRAGDPASSDIAAVMLGAGRDTAPRARSGVLCSDGIGLERAAGGKIHSVRMAQLVDPSGRSRPSLSPLRGDAGPDLLRSAGVFDAPGQGGPVGICGHGVVEGSDRELPDGSYDVVLGIEQKQAGCLGA